MHRTIRTRSLSTMGALLTGAAALGVLTAPAGHAATNPTPTATATPASPAATSPDANLTDPSAGPSSTTDTAGTAGDTTTQGLETSAGRRPYPGSPERESALVADQDRRLVQIRTVDSLARWSNKRFETPYRLDTGSAYSLVLTARRAPYTVKDLLGLAPQTFVREPDGAYLLSENIVIRPGATLSLASTGTFVLHMASDAKGFTSIVNDGGQLLVTGTEGSPARITSWDRTKGAPDVLTNDGRAYLRSVGGQVTMKHVDLQRLGFWSGRTGGLALTGTDRPNTGTLDALGKSVKGAERKTLEQAPKKTTGGVTLDQILPAGTLPIPELNTSDPTYSFVSASLDDVTTEGNAYGVFIANANGVEIRKSGFSHSLVDGVVMHRFVTNAVVDNTTAVDNGGDGIVLSRATTGIVLSEVTASDNTRNGVSISGLPLANGPSATGTAVGSYGNNALNNSTMKGNGRYGVEVIGGNNVGIQANDLVGNEVGVVVRDGARSVSVVGNKVKDATLQGIALRDGVAESTLSGNIVSGSATGIYLRDADASVRRNTLTGSESHGITIVGEADRTTVDGNTIAGRGSSAIDSRRAVGLAAQQDLNDTSGWSDTTPFLVTLKRFLQPLTAMWLALALLVVVTALRGLRRPRRFSHPYADKAPVSTHADVVTRHQRAAAR